MLDTIVITIDFMFAMSASESHLKHCGMHRCQEKEKMIATEAYDKTAMSQIFAL